VRRIMVHLRSIQRPCGLGAEGRGMMGFSKLPILNMRLLGAIVMALITLSALSNPEHVQGVARSQVARGEPGARIVSFAQSTTTAQIATINQSGRVTIRAPKRGWQIERFLDFPGYARERSIARS
jgi:hypothetical protein